MLVLLHYAGFESWTLSLVLAVALGVLITPTIVAGHGIGFVPWILAPGDLSFGIWTLPVMCFVAWLTIGRPFPPPQTETGSQAPPRSQEGRPPASAAPVLKFRDDDRAP